jgi:hypothetical protein
MLTKEEKDMIIMGLQMRRNYVETDTVNLSGRDRGDMGEEAFKACGGKIKSLVMEQMQLIIDTDNLINKITNM